MINTKIPSHPNPFISEQFCFPNPRYPHLSAGHQFSHSELDFIIWGKVIDLALRDQFVDSSTKLGPLLIGLAKTNTQRTIITRHGAPDCSCQIKLSVGLICFQQSQVACNVRMSICPSLSLEPLQLHIPVEVPVEPRKSSATHKSFNTKFDPRSLLADKLSGLRL